jgi:hypothetical protein
VTPRRHVWALLVVAVVLMIASLIVYSLLPIASVALGVGSGVVATVVAAHLGVLALFLILFILRRRSHGRKT